MKQITIKKNKKVCGNCGAELPDTSEEVAKFVNFKLLEENKELYSKLEKIKELISGCKDCDANACGVCSQLEGKANLIYKIANDIEVQNGTNN